MSLDKSIEHGKEHRKKYRGAKAVDKTCRNHGSCEHCAAGRMHKYLRQIPAQDEDAVQDLETCPFCGGEARYRMGAIGFGTYCNKCGAEVLFRPKGDLICGEDGNREAWNRRG